MKNDIDKKIDEYTSKMVMLELIKIAEQHGEKNPIKWARNFLKTKYPLIDKQFKKMKELCERRSPK
jgi:hypothetical protein